MDLHWKDDGLQRAQREEEKLRSQIGDLDEALQRTLPKAPPHPDLLHSREEWEELTRRPGFAPEMQRGSSADYVSVTNSDDTTAAGWERMGAVGAPGVTHSRAAEALRRLNEQWITRTRPRIVPEGAERTAEEMIEDKAKEVTVHLLDAIEQQAWQIPAPYTIDFPNAGLRMRTATDPDNLLRIVQDVEIVDRPTAKPVVEWGPGYCYAAGEGP